MTLEAFVQQLQEAKDRKLILRASMRTHTRPLVNGVWQPAPLDPTLLASVVIQFPETITDETLENFREFLIATFPNTNIQMWNVAYAPCLSFTVKAEYIKYASGIMI